LSRTLGSRAPFISVVIPCYDQVDVLLVCADSVYAQDYPRDKFEVVIVDDHSPTPLEAGLRRRLAHADNVTIVRNDRNRGPYFSRNRGARIARGSLLAFTDSDCKVDASWLRSIETALTCPEAVCVQGAQISAGAWGGFMEDGDRMLAFLKKRRRVDTKNFAIRKEVFDHYCFNEELRTNGDTDLGIRLHLDAVAVTYSPEVIVTHYTETLREVLAKARKYGEGQVYICRKYGWLYVNRKFVLPIGLLIPLYLCSGALDILLRGPMYAFARAAARTGTAIAFRRCWRGRSDTHVEDATLCRSLAKETSKLPEAKS